MQRQLAGITEIRNKQTDTLVITEKYRNLNKFCCNLAWLLLCCIVQYLVSLTGYFVHCVGEEPIAHFRFLRWMIIVCQMAPPIILSCQLVGPMGCRTNGLSDQWVVGPMGCRTNELSDHWVVGPMGRRTNGFSDQWAVGPSTLHPTILTYLFCVTI